MTTTNEAPIDASTLPDISISVRQVFGLECDMQVPAFSQKSEHVPDVDEAYRFDHDTTIAILAGFAYNRRVMIQGYPANPHQQVAARLNYPHPHRRVASAASTLSARMRSCCATASR
jgi:cobaltochelatase CobS